MSFVTPKKTKNHAGTIYPAGTIHWLPPKNLIPSEHLLAALEIDEDCLNHPVLVLEANSVRKEAAVLIITSFGGKTLLKRHPHTRDKKIRANHLPIYPSIHPDNDTCLYLVGDERLSKDSYVKITPTWIVKLTMLKHWRKGKFRLQPKSLHELRKQIDFESPWPSEHCIQQAAVIIPQPIPRQMPIQHQVPVHHQMPVRSHLTAQQSNHAPTTISCGSNHHVPGQWINMYDRPTYVQPSHHRTPLLLPIHNSVRVPPRPAVTSPWVNIVFALIFATILLMVGYMWYIGTP